jgi:arginyl-tRNA synthetase
VNVIDVRQSYLQKIVKEGLRLMGHPEAAEASVHFAYEMVALSQKTAAEFEMAGQIVLSDEDRAKPFVEMSGRKGLGVQADRLLDLLEEKAAAEVRAREPELVADEVEARAKALSVAALRYYMIRYGKNVIIPFDFEQALAFEGDTGPYLQYACVRAENILRKGREQGIEPPDLDGEGVLEEATPHLDDEGWALLSLFLRVPVQVRAAADHLDLNLIARQLFTAAQAFHAYYHHFPVLQEPDERKRHARFVTVALFARLLRDGLNTLLGIPVPERM